MSTENSNGNTMELMKLEHVDKHFPMPLTTVQRIARIFNKNIKQQTVYAVNDVTLSIKQGEVLGLVGESGCGKSTLARVIAGIHMQTNGTVLYKGGPVMVQKDARYEKLATSIQMVFQDPYASLNPRHRVKRIISEGPLYHGIIKESEADKYVCEMMDRAGIDPTYRFRYPHQFSGGQRQRIGIARALAMKPELLVCDEAVAALDVSIQAQVLNLFMDLKSRLDLTYIFVSHDLGVVRHISDRVAIMYLGKIVELAGVDEIFEHSNHPYTQALLANMLSTASRKHKFSIIKGEIPSPLDPPSGCQFHPRCPHAYDKCKTVKPALKEIAKEHFSACHLNDEDS